MLKKEHEAPEKRYICFKDFTNTEPQGNNSGNGKIKDQSLSYHRFMLRSNSQNLKPKKIE